MSATAAPITPGDGFRLLAIGETVPSGTEYLGSDGQWHDSTCDVGHVFDGVTMMLPRRVRIAKTETVRFTDSQVGAPAVDVFRDLTPGDIITAETQVKIGETWTSERPAMFGVTYSAGMAPRRALVAMPPFVASLWHPKEDEPAKADDGPGEGWRWLEKGEIIEMGDECVHRINGTFEACRISVGLFAPRREIRRRIIPADLPPLAETIPQKPTVDAGEGFRLLAIGEKTPEGAEWFDDGAWKRRTFVHPSERITTENAPHRVRVETAKPVPSDLGGYQNVQHGNIEAGDLIVSDKLTAPWEWARAIEIGMDVRTFEAVSGGKFRVYRIIPQPQHDKGAPSCAVPPPGWACTRTVGHDGPCAAAPVDTARPGLGGAPTRCTTLPTDAASRKQYPIATGFLDYFPDAVAAVAHLSWVANEQHNPGKPLHWDRSKSADEDDANMRHFLARGRFDTDGIAERTKAAWRSMAALQKEIEAQQKGAK